MKNTTPRTNGEGGGAKSYLNVLREGASKPGDCGRPSEEMPDWLDTDKLQRINDIYDKHWPGLTICTFLGQAFMSQVASMIKPLLYTGSHSTPARAGKRAALTMHYVLGWYKGSIWDTQNPAHKSIVTVRNIHKAVATAMTTKIPNDEAWISQYDMALIQFTVLAPALLWKKRLGLYCSDEEVDCLVHMLRLIGYLLGMEDRYNLGGLPYDVMEATCLDIVKEICQPTLANPVDEYTTVGILGVGGYADLIPLVEYNATYNFVCDVMGLEFTPKRLSFRGHVCSGAAWLVPKLLRFKLLRKVSWPIKRVLDKRIDRVVKKK